MKKDKDCIILIGMPGVGKSTVGVLLAKAMAKDFVDTDVLIQADQQQTLQNILDQRGYQVLRDIEASILKGLKVENTVVATGGSAVYDDEAMQHLRSLGTVVYLAAPFSVIKQRIHNEDQRGLARKPGQSLKALFDERSALYQKYFDIAVSTENKTADEVVEAVLQQLEETSR